MQILQVQINGEYIELNKLLKYCDLISSGGGAKYFMQENDIYYNQEPETRLRKKIYRGDIIKINNDIIIEVN